ncbi:MAG: hypothetical protein V1837_02915 [Candidatus Woesearchaeota archaeon]
MDDFISKYIFRCCRCGDKANLDSSSIFQDLLLDNLGFNKKREIVFEKILQQEPYRSTFDAVASTNMTTILHKKQAAKVNGYTMQLNHLRNRVAHRLFIIDEKALAVILQETFGKQQELPAEVRRLKFVVDLEGAPAKVDEWFNLIYDFFSRIKFSGDTKMRIAIPLKDSPSELTL